MFHQTYHISIENHFRRKQTEAAGPAAALGGENAGGAPGGSGNASLGSAKSENSNAANEG